MKIGPSQTFKNQENRLRFDDEGQQGLNDVLEKLCREVNLATVFTAKTSRKGDFLILLDKGSNKEVFTAKVSNPSPASKLEKVS